MKKFSITILVSLFLGVTLHAENTGGYDQMLQQSNKMIAVILVLVIILLGIAGFLFFLDKRIKKIEEQIKQN
jgi:CcmD family protein